MIQLSSRSSCGNTTSGTATASCYQSPRNGQPARDYRPEIPQKRLVNTETNDFLATLAVGYAKANCKVADGLLLAISGGADSIALLHGTLALWPDDCQKIVVAHVNHGLRGCESDEDAAFVAALAGQLGLRNETLTAEQGSIQHSSRGSVEAAARNVRYDFLTNVAMKMQLGSVVVAHHLDDQAETVLHNIIRGTGLRGLGGMRDSRLLADETQLVRPMLGVRKSAILAYLEGLKLPHRTDGSNVDTAFTRNRIRAELLPRLREDFNSAVDGHLVSLASQTQESLRMLDLFAAKILADVVLERTPHVCRIDRLKFAEWPQEVQRHCLSLLWIQQEWPRKKMNAGSYSALATAVGGAKERQRGDLPGGVTFEVSHELLRLTRCQ